MTEGENAYKLACKIYPIYRSITGEGVRETFRIIKDELADAGTLTIHEVPTGTRVFDWTVPKEWAIRDAYIENENGEKIISFAENSLCVVGYSISVDRWVNYDELLGIIHTEPNQPEVIPYVTSYYKEQYGFCMSENQKQRLKKGRYHIYIDSDLFDGSLTYAELRIKGEVEKEILFSTYSCHPSMGNDNCSGLALQTELARYVGNLKHPYYSYRFVYIPETIGSITYLSRDNNLKELQSNCIAGYTFSCVGDNGDYSIIKSKNENSLSDRALLNVLKQTFHFRSDTCKEYSFLERGSDERQYNSPGVGLSVAGFCRTKYWEFPEYHTSLDTIDFICKEGLQGSFDVMRCVVDSLENNRIYVTRMPCEPQLGKRGLYPNVSQKGTYGDSIAIQNFIAYADGKLDLIEISTLIGCSMDKLVLIVKKLLQAGLIEVK